MIRIAIIAASPGHIWPIAGVMRSDDVAEVAAMGYDPAGAIMMSLQASAEAWTGTVDDRPAVMFGVTDLGNGVGVPWLLGTDLVVRHQIAFLRRNRAYVDGLLAPGRWHRLVNHVDARNATSIRWLRWLGFTIGAAAPWGPFGLPFHLIERSA